MYYCTENDRILILKNGRDWKKLHSLKPLIITKVVFFFKYLILYIFYTLKKRSELMLTSHYNSLEYV